MRREFYFQDDKSNKFWHIERDGLRCTTYNGRVGAAPRSTVKDFDSEDKAQKFFDAPNRQQTKKRLRGRSSARVHCARLGQFEHE